MKTAGEIMEENAHEAIRASRVLKALAVKLRPPENDVGQSGAFAEYDLARSADFYADKLAVEALTVLYKLGKLP